MTKRILFSSLIVLSIIALSINMAWAETCNLPGGTALEVTIDNPVTCTEFEIPVGDTTIDINVIGTASVGEGLPVADTTLIYVIDASGSTAIYSGGDCGPDQNPTDPESVEDEIIDCEIAAAINLNNTAISFGTIDEVAMMIFAGDVVTADATPAGGDDPIITPDVDADSSGTTDVDDVLHSIWVAEYTGEAGSFNEFSIKDIPDLYNTDFADAIYEALGVASGASNPNILVIFLSDGLANAGDTVANALTGVADNIVFHTFAVGSASSCDGDPTGRGSLQDIADLTGGTCTEVSDPSNLPDILPAVIAATLDSLDIEVDGGGSNPISNEDIDPDLPQEDPVTVDYNTPVSNLEASDHEICVAAYGTDAGGSGECEECVTIHMIQLVGIDIKPGSYPNSINIRSKGKIPVAILSNASFDAQSIDPTSLTFGRTGDEESLAFCTDSLEDVNEDGLLDRVCHFYTQQTGFQTGDVEGILNGQTFGGQPIRGTDSVNIKYGRIGLDG